LHSKERGIRNAKSLKAAEIGEGTVVFNHDSGAVSLLFLLLRTAPNFFKDTSNAIGQGTFRRMTGEAK